MTRSQIPKGLIRRYWILTLLALASGLAGWSAGIPLTIGLCLLQVVHLALMEGTPTAFSIQVRLAYLGLLLLGVWLPLEPIHWVQLVGTAVRVILGYCLLARIVSLAPWNRRARLSWRLLKKTFRVRGLTCQTPAAWAAEQG